jgi:thioredoxin 1
MYQSQQPTREEIDRLAGLVVLEFGANWCPICQAAQLEIRAALESHPTIRRLQVEDGKGFVLGRSFGVKLWPNLVFLRDGVVCSQLARPGREALDAAVAQLLSS